MPYYAFSSDPRVADALACIGAAARRARHDRGLTQLRLELLTEVDQTTISRIENGLAPNVRLEYLARIIAVVGPLPPIATRSLRAPWERAFAPDDANATD